MGQTVISPTLELGEDKLKWSAEISGIPERSQGKLYEDSFSALSTLLHGRSKRIISLNVN